MLLEQQLQQRSKGVCELCQSSDSLEIYAVPPQSAATADNSILVCGTCAAQIEKREDMDQHHWRCLSASIWSEVPAVQVVSYRMLQRLSSEGWAADLLDMMYLEEETLSWAKAYDDEDAEAEEVHKDSLGSPLATGDTVVLTKTLDVKGSSLSAKLGTVVKNIRLVENNTDQIEGRIEGQLIVILTKYVRKQN